MFIDSPERNSAFDYKAIANDIFVMTILSAVIGWAAPNLMEAEDLAEVEAQLMLI
ncbi:hypothetical protein P3S68_000936 [Capsicum galapagoense]